MYSNAGHALLPKIIILWKLPFSDAHEPAAHIHAPPLPLNPAYADTLGLNFCAALSNSASFSSRSVRNGWAASASFKLLPKKLAYGV